MKPNHCLIKCRKCGRKIIVIQIFYGVAHSYIECVYCGECMKENGIDAEWAKENQLEAEAMSKFLEESS